MKARIGKWLRRGALTIWTLLVLLALPPLTITGCYTTRFVQRLGVTNEAVDSIDSVRMAPDGHLAVGVETVYFREGWGILYPNTRIIGHRRRWLVAPPDQMQMFLAQYPPIWGFPEPWMIVGPLELNSPRLNAGAWSFYPDDWNRRDGVDSVLPPPLAEALPRAMAPWSHPYEQGTTPSLAMSACVLTLLKGEEQVNIAFCDQVRWTDVRPWYIKAPAFRSRREWWGYPLQVFLIPAVIIDVVTSPLQVWAVAPLP